MAISIFLSRGIMSLAARLVPTGHRDFAHAMREEFEVLDGDRLGWALGCLGAAAGWRLRADGVFLTVMIGVAATLDQAMALSLFAMPGDLVHAVAYYYWLAFPALACGLLAAWRPGYAYAVVLVVFLIREGMSVGMLFRMVDAPLDRAWHIMDAPPIVGWSALLGWSFMGAAIGAALGRRRIARVKSS